MPEQRAQQSAPSAWLRKARDFASCLRTGSFVGEVRELRESATTAHTELEHVKADRDRLQREYLAGLERERGLEERLLAAEAELVANGER